jgi:hypothetical protein
MSDDTTPANEDHIVTLILDPASFTKSLSDRLEENDRRLVQQQLAERTQSTEYELAAVLTNIADSDYSELTKTTTRLLSHKDSEIRGSAVRALARVNPFRAKVEVTARMKIEDNKVVIATMQGILESLKIPSRG